MSEVYCPRCGANPCACDDEMLAHKVCNTLRGVTPYTPVRLGPYPAGVHAGKERRLDRAETS